MPVKRGEIVLVRVPDTSGLPGKTRPALVVSSDLNNQRLQDVIVAVNFNAKPIPWRLRTMSPFRRWLLLAFVIAALLGQALVLAGEQEGKNEPRSSFPAGGRARVKFFGISADGYKFVYVLDRSASMAGNPLKQAKAELKASLQGLGETHQFQIVFYNQQPKTFALAGVSGKAVFGNDQNKAAANKYIDGIAADGNTDHEPALSAAFNFSPDVIFFLTDADKPELSAERLKKITDRNRSGAIIHAIQFGAGPAPGANFLSRLAEQNAGSYRYVDTTKPTEEQPGDVRR